MKTLILTAILLGFGTGLVWAETQDPYAYSTMQQVRSGSYAAPSDQDRTQRFLGR